MPPESLRCRECQTVYPLDARYVCERCFGPLEVRYGPPADADPELLRRRIQAGPHSLWRYGDFLPVSSPPSGALAAGWTPLLRADRLAQRLGLREVWVKNDAANPTHSFKDRVVAVALARARELGFETVACASTGNLANAVAAHSAAAGLRSYVFIPRDLEEQKILATGVYGTQIVAVDGNYDDVNRLCTELSGEHEWAFVNINMRPYYAEGSKTLAFETAEQLGFRLPDRVVAPIASGSLYTKIARGFREWIDAGLLEGSMPVFCGAQALGCAPVAEAFAAGRDFCRPVKPDTIARSLAIGNPADGPYALELARSSGGSIDAVDDDEIRAGIRLLAQTTGIFTETAGGVATAVLAKLAQRGDIEADERVVLYITGEGLKTLDAVRGTFETWQIEPTVRAFESAAQRDRTPAEPAAAAGRHLVANASPSPAAGDPRVQGDPAAGDPRVQGDPAAGDPRVQADPAAAADNPATRRDLVPLT
ncbi:MAG TPA: threonine synthase [Solirubrobacteraceae bacterium]|nr:threonine synthase [Solirubrobacteraceae bacterium]